MGVKAACIGAIVRKGKVVCNIVEHLAEIPPVNPLFVLKGVIFHQDTDLLLKLLKGRKVFVSLCEKGGLNIWEDASQAKSLSVGLKAVYCRHLICQIAGQ